MSHCKYGELPDFTAIDLNTLATMGRKQKYYAEIRATIMRIDNDPESVASEKQFRLLWAIKRESEGM